jgi:prevent-host-death family protein
MATSDEERMGVSEARANLTEVIAKVRLLGQQVVLTCREKPQAVLVSHEFYEQALRDRDLLERLRDMAGLPAGVSAEQRPDLVHRARIIHEALESAERHVAES